MTGADGVLAGTTGLAAADGTCLIDFFSFLIEAAYLISFLAPRGFDVV